MTTTSTTPATLPTFTLDQLAKAKIGTGAASGHFIITGADGKTSAVSFSQLLLSMGMQSLDVTRNTFNTQYAIAQERVTSMKELNDLVQAMNLYKNHFKSDGKVTDEISKRNDDLYKTLLSNLTVTTKDGKTYIKGTDGTTDVGPIEHLYGKGNDASKLTKKDFNDFLKDPDGLKSMLNEAELYLMLADNKDDGATRYMDLVLEVLDYHKQWDTYFTKRPSLKDLSPPLTGDNLAFMQKILPLLDEADNMNYGFFLWAESGSRYYCYKEKTFTDDKGKEHKCKVGVFALDASGTAQAPQIESYTRLLNTPLQPDGYTLPEIMKLHEEVENSSTQSCMSAADLQMLRDYMSKNPGTLNVKPEDIMTFDNKELETFLSNCQTAQSTLSSLNEQQSMRTNQAMQRSSGMLETLQTLLQTAKQARDAAAGTGGA